MCNSDATQPDKCLQQKDKHLCLHGTCTVQHCSELQSAVSVAGVYKYIRMYVHT